MEYMVHSATSVEELEDSVNEALKTGWELHYGVSVAACEDCDIYAQALIRKHGEND